MAVRGTLAKQNVENKIKEIFGDDFIGVADKKLYVFSDDGGQKIQIAISLTCPKVGIETDSAAPSWNNAPFDWSSTSTPKNDPLDLTPAEEETVAQLIAKLGL